MVGVFFLQKITKINQIKDFPYISRCIFIIMICYDCNWYETKTSRRVAVAQFAPNQGLIEPTERINEAKLTLVP